MSKIYGYNVNTKRTHLVKDYMPNKRRKSKCDAIKWYIHYNLFSIRFEDQWIFDFMRRVCSSFGRWFFWFYFFAIIIICHEFMRTMVCDSNVNHVCTCSISLWRSQFLSLFEMKFLVRSAHFFFSFSCKFA